MTHSASGTPRQPADPLPGDVRIGRVHLQVADLQRSLAWYDHILGMKAAFDGPGQATLSAADDTPLLVLHERPGAARVPRHGRLGLYHFAVLLPGRDHLGRFLAHLHRLGVPAGASDHLVSEALYLHDPDGLGVEVYADRPRDDWRADAHGQLRMGTQPLDTRAVIQAAGNTEWEGMPAGTTIGHIHLHVSDLEQATAFYVDTLGFSPTVWSYPGALFVAAGGYHHHVGLNTWAAHAPAPTENDARLLEWELLLPSPESLTATLARTRSTLAPDPWGTPVHLLTG